MKRYGLGIDIGGTFTDIVVYDSQTGTQFGRKELTTHGDPSDGVMTGIDNLLADGAIAVGEVGRVVHATTLFTNALIERKGAVTGLHHHRRLPRHAGDRPRAQVRTLRHQDRQARAAGAPPSARSRSASALRPTARYIRPSMKRPSLAAARELVAKASHRWLSPSCTPTLNPTTSGAHMTFSPANFPASPSAPRSTWHLRSANTSAPRRLSRNAYIKPLAERYLVDAGRAHRARAASMRRLLMMLSNGGLTNIDEAKRSPVQLLESGPAAGALVAAHFGSADGGATCSPSTWAAPRPN